MSKKKKQSTQQKMSRIASKKLMERNSYIKLTIIVIAVFLAELIIGNSSAIGMMFSGTDKVEINLKEKTGSQVVEVKENEPLEIKDINAEMANIMITSADTDTHFAMVSVAFTDDNFRYSDAFNYNKVTDRLTAAEDFKNVMQLSSFGEVGTIKISSSDGIKISGISLNVMPPFRFSIVRFMCILAAVVCIAFGVWKRLLGDDDVKFIRITAAALCVMVLFVGNVVKNTTGYQFSMDVPDSVYDEDEYTQLFDAIRNGHTYLDIEADPEMLDNLDCPYDRSERNEKNATGGGLWDRAYYDGKFYSYFGVAPIYTVYYPFYMFTHKYPTTLGASMILCLYCVIFLSLLYELFIRKLCREVPTVLGCLGLIGFIFGSVIFAVASEVRFYYVAVLSGIAWTAAFFVFLFNAYYSESFKKRVILLVCTGLSVVLIAASRPTLLLYCFIGIIPAIEILSGKKDELKTKIEYVCAVGVPIVIGAVAIMAYNKARFDSPFEFGFNYQLTVSRAQANTVKLSLILPALYHYFLQSPSFKSAFPYIELRSFALDSYTRYNYNGVSMGVLMYPIAWGAFLAPFSLTRKDKFKFSVVSSFAGAAVLMSYIDMCKAGAHYRYTTDIAFVVLLVALIAVFDLLAQLREKNEKAYKLVYAFAAVALVVTIIFGGLLVYSNEGDKFLKDYPEAIMYLRTM